jgi:excisionase family DNA binding protein
LATAGWFPSTLYENASRPMRSGEMSDGLVPNRLLTIKEIAKILHVNERTIRRRIDAGYLATIRTGRIVRIHPNEVKRILSEGLSI